MKTVRSIVAAVEYEEVQSDLFRESGVNASTEDAKIHRYAASMRKTGGWGKFPPIEATIGHFNKTDWDDYQEAVEGGYEHEKAYSRPPTAHDIGKEMAFIFDGHNRAYAARTVGIPLRVRIW